MYVHDQFTLFVNQLEENKMESKSPSTSEKIREGFQRNGNVYPCTVGEDCSYAPSMLNIFNCTRHAKEQHPVEYNVLGIGKRLSDEEVQFYLKRKRSRTTAPDAKDD